MQLLLFWAVACGPTESEAPAGSRPPTLVGVGEVRAGTLDDTWSYLGDVRALERAELAAGASGTLAAVSVREGDAVKTGDVLAEVDLQLAAAEFGAARAGAERAREEHAQAERTLERLRRVDGGVLAANELEAAESTARTLGAAADAAEAARRVAAARLERHRVRAPFAGVVARRHTDPGDWVDPGTPVLDLVSTGSVEIRVEAPLDLARKVAPGEQAQLTGPTSITATIVGVVPALDPVSRTAVVRLAPDENPDWLVPGTATPVGFRIRHDGGLVVPRDAVVSGAVDERVFAVVEGTAHPIVVQTLASSADEVLVRGEGLTAGDSVVTRGNERLRPDQPVKVEP